MARYSIDGQILTDLGDYIRVAKFEENPREIHAGHVAYEGFEGLTTSTGISVNTKYTKNKVTIFSVNWTATSTPNTPRVSISGDDWNAATGHVYMGDELPFSHIATSKASDDEEGLVYINCFYGAADITYMIEPCDDNGEVIKNTYTPEEIVDELNALPVPLPEEVLNLSGDFTRRFYNDNWLWFIEKYGYLIKTNKISNLTEAFYFGRLLKRIPFDLNLSNSCSNFKSCFAYCYALEEAPKLVGPLSTNVVSSYSGPDFTSIFETCTCIRELPDDYFTSLATDDVWMDIAASTYGNRSKMFYACSSLRKLPDLSKLVNLRNTASHTLYYRAFYGCSCLDEITNLPLHFPITGNGFSLSSNMFDQTFTNCFRLKNMTFELQDNGSARDAYWTKQAIYLNSAGWANDKNSILGRNSGITKDKQVTDDASYQALKDDPDWWTLDMAYSRYNHDSAVATINSLPDTSFRGGVNTITFKGEAGSKTDGGAINTLTEEEIAVATAKGWTVSLT